MKTKEGIVYQATKDRFYLNPFDEKMLLCIHEAMELYAQQLVSDRDARIKFLDDAFQGMVNTNEGHVLELGDRDREIAEANEKLRLCNIDQINSEAKLSSLKSLLGKCLPYLKEMNEDNIEDLSVGIRQDRELIDLLSSISEQLDKK